jgi:hypothetical protein
MRSSDLGACAAALLVAACASETQSNGTIGEKNPAAPTVLGGNVMQISVNGALCSTATSQNYANKPCVRVTLCTPGTSTCRTVDDILLDTGSFGLRVFSSALSSLSLSDVSSGGSSTLGECMYFADGTVLWGRVAQASVVLGSEPAVTVPIQVADSAFMSGQVPCSVGSRFGTSLAASPADAGLNGILGVGPFLHDCGDACTSMSNNGYYFSCSASAGCTPTTAALSSQVANPAGALSTDGNGLIVQLPALDASGAHSATGNLIFGIDTRGNNASAGEIALDLGTDITEPSFASFNTTFEGSVLWGFADTGSTGLYFPTPQSGFPTCYNDWFCPATTQSLSATLSGFSNGASSPVTFRIGNATTLFNSGKMVFDDLGGRNASGFDWGLPFHFGRTVYVGFAGKSSKLGTGPYIAF